MVYDEAAGAVCLPTAGYRLNSEIRNVCENGHYWSSSALDNDEAYNLSFRKGVVVPNHQDLRSLAFSVRLVTDVK